VLIALSGVGRGLLVSTGVTELFAPGSGIQVRFQRILPLLALLLPSDNPPL
jgi:hypothetical protein